MSANNSLTNNGSSFIDSEISLPRPIRFWLLLLSDIPSTICALCLIVHIIINPTQRRALHNHSIFLVLIFNLPIQIIDISFHLVFLHYGSVEPSQPIVCLIWWLIDFGFYIGSIILMAWLAIERHILVFHDRWIANRRGRFLFHYLPMIILVTYILLFYIICVFFLPCINDYNYKLPVCNAVPCYQSYGILGMWEFNVNTSTPLIIEFFASTSFIIRVVRQRQRLRRSTQWRKQRRLTIQLLLMSSVNMIFNFPISFIPLLHKCGLPPEYGVQAELYFFFLGYFVTFLFPFVCLVQYPELRKQIKQKIFCSNRKIPNRTATVAPTLMGTRV